VLDALAVDCGVTHARITTVADILLAAAVEWVTAVRADEVVVAGFAQQAIGIALVVSLVVAQAADDGVASRLRG
jgi:hypothetical protein